MGDDSCFTKSGKIKSTQTCAHKFNEECFGRLQSITDRIESALSTTKCMHEKHRRMYPEVKQAQTSRKRRQKENKAKSKKRKHDRHEKNCKRVYDLVVINNSLEGTCGYGNTANASNLNSTGISSLKTSDMKWLKMLIERKMFTKSAVSVIQSLIMIPTGSLPLSDSDTSSDGDDEYEMDGNESADDVLCL